ncbi:MAG TPA: 3-deoxy-7-phosphoheptulonate synthase [Acidimicrobiia bacterium]|nr:3-deoxy-7-phosphoheptulonate synthase [Acidimicrobiia bacterium]
MIIVMRREATSNDIENVVTRLHDIGCEAHVSEGQLRTVIGAIGDRNAVQTLPWEAMPGVERAVPVLKSFKFVSRDFQEEDTVIEVGGVKIGGGTLTVIAGPCAVEDRDQLMRTAEAVVAAGADVLRGDAFKPRTSPYSFQGLGEKGLELLAEARDEFHVPFVAEVLDAREVELVSSYADILRIGTRNMANYTLLAEVGRQAKPVQLKRGFTATLEEWLNAAEYIYKEGNHQIMMVERGIRTFETAARNTLDITAVPLIKAMSHLPIIVDPSHAGGKRELVAPLARAGVGAGADGIMVDVHPAPDTAKVDGEQALLPSEFADLVGTLRALASVLGYHS